MIIEIDLSDHDVVTAHVGDDIVVRLAETPSTGYRWALTQTGAAVGIVDDETRIAPDAAPGAGGQRVFTVHVTAPGSAEFVWRLVRSWQPDLPVDEQHLTVAVAG